MNIQKSYKRAFILVTSLFFLWGVVTVLKDSLVPRLKDVFELNYFEAGLVQCSFFSAYFLFSIPAGFILAKIGYQRGIILGLLLVVIGCFLFYPAASERLIGIYTLAIFVLASGITFLQVAANPYVSILGTYSEAPKRLTLSQAFNSLGTSVAPIIGAIFILSNQVLASEEITLLNLEEQKKYFTSEATDIQIPFITIAFVVTLLALLFAFIRLPNVKIKNNTTSVEEYFSLFKKQGLVLGAIAILLYVGAEVSIGSYLVNYFIDINITKNILESDALSSLIVGIGKVFGIEDLTQKDPKGIVGIFVAFYWMGAMLGRFIGMYLTKIISPAKALITFSLLAILLIIISVNTVGLISMWSILAVGLFNSIMFPTIFTLASEGLENFKPQVSGILCTMIVGGAIIPPIFGLIIDNVGFKMAFLSLVVCYGFVLFFGYYKRFVKP